MNTEQRLRQITLSIRSLPLWARLWIVLVVVPVNAAGFFMLHTVSGWVIAIAALFVLTSNAALLWHRAGMSRLLSIPQLIAWVPLLMLLVSRLVGGWGPDEIEPGEWALAVLAVMVTAVTLFFDVVESWRWWQGERFANR
ncbi:hypothetical protein [Alloalcanivorax mobilis]|uniref:hypothetical protein n=1 Tax=Alloalcanivorax mobilis TaxID=2019569 RepID=UPI000B5B3361|nr:hypothetical protein [Alloalcanivorax mobilis]ASK35406.1 hypothetical protein CEK62_13960 [Alcanivorax sp. N3-2A]|tara:strand:+ start:5809 stop:6228 length:420 start_codon:yes stop_codon:yes gene_type:complete